MTGERGKVFVDEVRAIWCRELECSDITPEQDFFALGGHSVIMARIQRAYIDEMGYEIPMDEMYRYPTIASISAYMESLP
ncbi:hypothetical protein GCM10010112_62460 [Actinoplanes lobatus]|uniref:Carrier domain-containing protein n=1 Tax=Actinoplanes lobatus TaxID=113568 RepID=A0ABQ4AYD4_9ACTN|nr:hypothetical protein GCM10010112_62460 [Actinoplanes lobatus]GIE46023.1 hypothetical protein Alo02nite_89210 [Actinoplanes lobatus]